MNWDLMMPVKYVWWYNQVDTIAAKGAGAVSVAVSYGFTAATRLEQENPDYLFKSFPDFASAVISR